MVLACMKAGMDGLMQFAFSRRDIFPKPDDATKRAYWLKKQPIEYIDKVSERAVELEKK